MSIKNGIISSLLCFQIQLARQCVDGNEFFNRNFNDEGPSSVVYLRVKFFLKRQKLLIAFNLIEIRTDV